MLVMPPSRACSPTSCGCSLTGTVDRARRRVPRRHARADRHACSAPSTTSSPTSTPAPTSSCREAVRRQPTPAPTRDHPSRRTSWTPSASVDGVAAAEGARERLRADRRHRRQADPAGRAPRPSACSVAGGPGPARGAHRAGRPGADGARRGRDRRRARPARASSPSATGSTVLFQDRPRTVHGGRHRRVRRRATTSAVRRSALLRPADRPAGARRAPGLRRHRASRGADGRRPTELAARVGRVAARGHRGPHRRGRRQGAADAVEGDAGLPQHRAARLRRRRPVRRRRSSSGTPSRCMVAQRTRELALLRAIGATRRQVLRALVAEAAAARVSSPRCVGVAAGHRRRRGLVGADGGLRLRACPRAGDPADVPGTPGRRSWSARS